MKWVILLCLFLTACSGLLKDVVKEPKVSMDHVSVKDATLQGATLLFFLKVENPNSFALKVDEMSYKVFIDEKLLTTTKTTEVLKVQANGEGVIALPLPIEYATLWQGISSFFSKRTLNYRIEGDARTLGLSVPFKSDGNLNLDELLKNAQ